jgi:cation diffusion facilitator family transporter
MTTEPLDLRTQKIGAARLSIVSNSLLTLLKLTVGVVSGSVSILSEAIHSASDLVASWIAFFSVRVSDRPADRDHPYGHGKIESLSSLAEALLIFAAAGYIIVESVEKWIARAQPEKLNLGMAVMGLSVVVNVLVARFLFRVARRTESLALEADAEHLRTDVYTSLGVLAGLALTWATDWHFIDPLVAIAVALLILHTAWQLTRRSLEPLMDAHLPQEEVASIRRILDSEPEVLGYHKLRTRKSGSHRHIDAHILLDDDLTLLEAHDLTERIEDRIRASIPNVEIMLHTEPYRAEQRHQHEHHGGPPPQERNP